MSRIPQHPERKAVFAGNVYRTAHRMTQHNTPGGFLIPFSWWPFIVSCILVPILCLAGGADLGVYGEENAFRQCCVSIAWLGIPLGVLISIFCGFFIVTERGRGWETFALWLCCLVVFPVYAVFVMALLT